MLENSDKEHDLYEWLGHQHKLYDYLYQVHICFLKFLLIGKDNWYPLLIKLLPMFAWAFDCIGHRQPLGKKVDIEHKLGHLENVEKLREVAHSQIS